MDGLVTQAQEAAESRRDIEREQETYCIIRFYRDPDRESVVKLDGLTLDEAQEHCNDPETSSRTATSLDEPGEWFDGYEAE